MIIITEKIILFTVLLSGRNVLIWFSEEEIAFERMDFEEFTSSKYLLLVCMCVCYMKWFCKSVAQQQNLPLLLLFPHHACVTSIKERIQVSQAEFKLSISPFRALWTSLAVESKWRNHFLEVCYLLSVLEYVTTASSWLCVKPYY